MQRTLDRKTLSEITGEWDALAPLRLKQITSGADISYNRVITPALMSLIDNFKLSRALDAGCGTGVFTGRLSEFASEVVGIDPSEKSIEIAKSLRLNRATFIQSTAEEYSTDHMDSFDVVIANMVLMDVLSLNDFLTACKRMLVARGIFAFSITHPCFWPEYYGYSNETWFDYGSEIIVESPFRISADRIGSLVSTHIHRPLSAYFDSFIRCGFSVRAIAEPKPPDDTDETYRAAWKFPRYIVGLLQR
jgi:SAM-dependent methyltransferase